jgi:NADH-ubiquinone oxidoreductase chain 4L
MSLSLLLYMIALLGFIVNRKNLVSMLLCIELMLLAIALAFLLCSLRFDDMIPQAYAVLIIAVAGAESAVFLGVVVAYYRQRGSISMSK